MMHVRFLYISILIIMIFTIAAAKEYVLLSPNQIIRFKINIDNTIEHSVFYNEKPVIVDSPFSLEFAQSVPYRYNWQVIDQSTNTADENWKPVYGKHAQIRNHYNEIKLTLKESTFPGRTFELIYRAYDDGVAFRYHFPGAGMQEQLKLKHENTYFNFPDDYTVWMADYNIFTSSQEKEFWQKNLSNIYEESIVGLPLLIKTDENIYAAITEADLTDWAALYLTSGKKDINKPYAVKSILAPIPNSSGEDANKPLLAYVYPPASSPWRVIMLNDDPVKLLESEILMNLNDPCAIEDPIWIKPGKCTWDGWWTGRQMSTELLKEYIDLAAHLGFPYQLVDAGWYVISEGKADVTKINPEIDLPGLFVYAKERNVRLWLWIHWQHLDLKYKEAFALYEKWGVAGVKIDFMDRDDQEMVNWYHKIVKEAAKHYLMINFHGAYKPTGFRRTYPNLVTREGVLGNEYNKWSDRVTPEHTLTIAFTRNLLGEMEFTPGGFLNKGYGLFKATSPTQVMGTRAHQLAMLVIYESPMTFLCDYPKNYYNQPGIDFLKIVPTVWDDIKGINGQVGEFITVAKKSGNDWFIGAMTDSKAREYEIKLDFLDAGRYEVHIFQDSVESNSDAEKIELINKKVNKGDSLKIKMCSGGGFVAYIEKLN